MKIKKLNSIIVLGLVATIGILIAQLLWTKEAFSIEEQKFSQKAHIALINVVKHLYEGTNHEVPANNPVKKVSNDYYIINVDNDFDPEILEHYLKVEFEKIGITTDFEYAMYNCHSDEMVYGNYISFSNKTPKKTSISFPKHKNLIYYFAIRFPNETSYLFSSLRFWFILSFALIIILLVYVYSIYTIIQQKKYSELQRDFINNMTHEFKTPLSSILIASNYLNQQEDIKKDQKLEKYTKIIIDQTHKLNHHIEKILNIAKSDNAPLVLEKSEFTIIPVIASVIESIQLKYPDTKITIDSKKDDYKINADQFHFTNLIYNLIDNSVKYCDCYPEITIKLSDDTKQLKIEFIDNGIGISNKNISFVFDKFYRIPTKKSNEVSGFGLGLYYVKKICTQHNWKILMQNNNKQGITITILTPLT
ncbi:HAMP domain-containing histidine kinase [Flavobacterium amniphilum]|uniref:sensor histidine kinase n=1 Tax=Flavobacterium amniphilum TaxID=1834035 RepID=UPI00202A3A3A|nr:HAMP domain-containing sensor histidine kinase [Flavobacterium amniphilum]MCL9805763.1 HAMP domain-containing histidine kinase [Flavobacterium amniphilum]MCL9806350.1 HAMP domain-containing histidine kinase [Flavobacterium amniphilum]